MKKDKIKIAFVGGGTLGPVTPLLAVMKKIAEKRPDAKFIWFGTPHGPERELIPKDVAFFAVPVAKFPRHLSMDTLKFPFMFLYAAYKARKLMRREKPDLVIGAGGYTQVPVIRAAHGCGIPAMIHQLDKEPGLSNRMIADKTISITTSFEYKKEPFSGPVKSRRIATPVRFDEHDLASRKKGAEYFGLDASKPITLIIGGGTGALSVNEAVRDMLSDLLPATQIIHVTGKGKRVDESRSGYVVKEFLTDELIFAYSAADVIVTRAGMGAISECSALGKPMILVPIAGSQQEKNAAVMEEAHAAVVLRQDADFQKNLLNATRGLLKDEHKRRELTAAAKRALPTDDGTMLAETALKFLL